MQDEAADVAQSADAAEEATAASSRASSSSSPPDASTAEDDDSSQQQGAAAAAVAESGSLAPPASTAVPASSLSAALKLTPAQFRPLHLLGSGSYSQVYEVLSLVDGCRYAMKVLSKAHLHRHRKEGVAVAERDALRRCSHPCILRLFHTFQDSSSLYFILELAEGGDVLTEVEELQGYPLSVVRFYAAQLLACLHFLHHSARVIHRDVKPDNLLLSADRQLKLADFGTAKILQPAASSSSPSSAPPPLSPSSSAAGQKKHSFVGTAAYVAPEVLQEGGECGFGVDLWSAGCSIYQMLTATTPFNAPSEYLIFQRILSAAQPDFPPGLDPDAVNLIGRLMERDVARRLGSRAEDWQEVQQHPFFRGIDWEAVSSGRGQCPPLPSRLQGKKFSLMSEDSLLGWGEKAAEERKDEDEAAEAVQETRRGEIIRDVTLDGPALAAPSFRGSQLSVQREERDSEVKEESRQQQHSNSRPEQRAHSNSAALQQRQQRPLSPLPPLQPSSPTCPQLLQPGEMVLVRSSVAPVAQPSRLACFSFLACLMPSPPAPRAAATGTDHVAELLLTSAGRLLLAEADSSGAYGAASRQQELSLLTPEGGGSVKCEAGPDGKTVLLARSKSGQLRKWELQGGGTGADWLRAAAQLRTPP